MSCLAISLQPNNGSDILLQTREWFPPARALVALSAFRQTRLAFALAFSKNNHPSAAMSAESESTASSVASLGDDPLAASSGQVIVGVESRYRVVYRLVNSIYVLGITTADHDDNSINVFECIHIVNQAVSVVVTACRGVDVTPEKLSRKYAEIYMALDIVLRGVSSIRLAAMLGSMHADGIAKMVHSAQDTESKIRGADNWTNLEVHSVEHLAGVEAFSNARFELPAETLAAGDEVSASLAPIAQSVNEQQEQPPQEEAQVEKDPFAASDAINKPQELVSGFKKNKDPSATDLTLALAGIEVTTLPPAEATQSTYIGVEGFEGDYGGVAYAANEKTTLDDDFQGFNAPFGGGLDASEFLDPKKAPKPQGLGGVELLQTGNSDAPPKSVGGAQTPLENLLVKTTEQKGPEMYIVEEINAEFRDSLLSRVGLMGVVYLKTLPPKVSGGDKETEFSFRVEGTNAVKRFVMQSSRVSSLENGIFHVRTAGSDEPIPVLKYSLLPRLTPVPLRVRLIKRQTGTLLSVMIQYVSNPDLPIPLNDVTFVLKLPVDPSLLKVSPKAMLNRSERELKWHIPEIPAKGSPGRLRVRMPVESSEEDGGDEMEIVGYVKFSLQGIRTLSGVCLRPASEGKTDFYEVSHRYESGVYMCN